MRCLIQRSLKSQVMVNDNIVGKIERGIVVLVGFTSGDDINDIEYMVKKIITLRIFDDENGVMNRSLLDIDGEALVVSQFTLYADASKGRRPSYIKALSSNEALPLYNLFVKRLQEQGIVVATGKFGADMCVSISNDGPITIMIESRGNNDKK